MHPNVHSNVFTITKTWREPKYPSIDDGLRRYNGLRSHKKEWNIATCSNMDGARECHTKWGKSDKDRYYMISHICGI